MSLVSHQFRTPLQIIVSSANNNWEAVPFRLVAWGDRVTLPFVRLPSRRLNSLLSFRKLLPMNIPAMSLNTRWWTICLSLLVTTAVSRGAETKPPGAPLKPPGAPLKPAAPAAAAPAAVRIQVQGIQGRAQFSRKGGPFAPLAPGAELLEGDVIRTASGSALDLAFADLPAKSLVRITEVTTLILGKIASGPASLELVLQAGELLTQFPTLPTDTRFEVKTSVGLARVLGGRCRIQARGFVVVLDGKTLFAHVPTTGDPLVHTLAGPPATYFTPTAGLQPAPRDLSSEVASQIKARLKKE